MFSFSARRRRERDTAGRIYAACLTAARRPELYLSYGVPDTLQGRFEMVALALSPVLNRLMHEPGDDPGLARLISECFVDDMDGAFREMGTSDAAVPKRMKTLYSSFAGRITAYREAGGDEVALTAALGRNVFPDAPEDERAQALAKYLGAATAAITAADLSDIRRGEIPFPPLVSLAKRQTVT
jgi:cytochrome b pre-mRNA-processing protein 3